MLQQALCRYFCSYFVYVYSSDLVLSNNETNNSELIGVGCPLWIATRWVCRLSGWWELLYSGCADCLVYTYYCTLVVQTVHSMGITAQWLYRLSILWELLHSGCTDCPFYGNYCTVVMQTPVSGNYCTVVLQTPVSGNYCSMVVQTLVSGNYCTVVVQTVQSVGITAQWLCRLQSLGITAQWLCRLSRLWVFLHSGCVDRAGCGNYCKVVMQTPVTGNYCTVVVQTVQSMGITAQYFCRLSGLWELLQSGCADCPVSWNYCTPLSQCLLLEEQCANCPVSRSQLPDYIWYCYQCPTV
jgi:hypothetical protein